MATMLSRKLQLITKVVTNSYHITMNQRDTKREKINIVRTAAMKKMIMKEVTKNTNKIIVKKKILEMKKTIMKK